PDESFTTLPGIEIKSNEAGCLTICGDITFGKELVTRDRVEITESGQFKVLGRIDNVINSAGIKIQAEKVETQLELIFHNYPDTYTFFVGGIPHPRWGEQVTLFIDKNLPFWEDVKKKLSLHLNKYEVPKAFIVCPAFEMTPSGKINRKGTIAHFVKNQERKV
ncbi:MAG: hypothetical protein OEX02_08725, partial [Cyclobacteriaceae bacterium]|nr:hypothetical protein [Cyclobacteriaceae bacterium]